MYQTWLSACLEADVKGTEMSEHKSDEPHLREQKKRIVSSAAFGFVFLKWVRDAEQEGSRSNATGNKATEAVLKCKFSPGWTHSWSVLCSVRGRWGCGYSLMACRFWSRPWWVSGRWGSRRLSASSASVHSRYRGTCVHTYRWLCPPPDQSTPCTRRSCCTVVSLERPGLARGGGWEESWGLSLRKNTQVRHIPGFVKV